MTFDKLASLANNYILEAKVRPPTEEEKTEPYYAYEYAKNVVKGRVPELEPLILTDMASTYDYTFDLVEGRWPEAEETFATGDPGASVGYAKNHLKTRWINVPEIPKDLAFEAESYLLNSGSPENAVRYAIDVIGGRWPELEELIFSGPEFSDERNQYINGLNEIGYEELEESSKRYVTEAKRKVRKPTKEERTDPYYAYEYAKNVVKGRVPELEPLILTDGDGELIYDYLNDVVQGRWPEVEEMVSTGDPAGVYGYALDRLKDRWINIPDIPETIAKQAEDNLLSEPDMGVEYAINVIKGRWPELEEVILSQQDLRAEYVKGLNNIGYEELDESFKRYVIEAKRKVRPPTKEEQEDINKGINYAANVLKDRWDVLEQKILDNWVGYMYSYAKNVIKGRWPEAENLILDDVEMNGGVAAKYAKHIIKHRWPELEDRLLEGKVVFGGTVLDIDNIMYYLRNLIKGKWPKLEPHIINNPEQAVRYAVYGLNNKRWLEAEPYIMQDPVAAYNYAKYIINGRWPEAEEAILNHNDVRDEYIDFLNSIGYEDVEESFNHTKRFKKRI